MGLTVGLDVGGTKVLGVVVDAAGKIVDEQRRATPTGGDALIDVLVAQARSLIERTGAEAVGIGAPGLVDRQGVLQVGPNLPGIVGLDLTGIVSERLDGLRVTVGNDATLACLAEWVAGAAIGVDDVVMVTLGTGIGGGAVVGGRLHLGANGFAGEVGHMVVDVGGPPCPCGKRGCWERFASGSGLGALGRAAALANRLPAAVDLAGGDPEAVKGEHVTAAAAAGDAAALEVLDDFGGWVALGLANLTMAFDPARIVVGGGLVEAGDLILDPTRKSFRQIVPKGEHRPVVDIVAAELGEHAGAVGAALLARDGAPGT